MAGGLNLYGYAAGDPINGSDPFGLDPSYDLIVRYVAGEIGGGSARNQEAISTLANEATQRAVRALINRSAIVGVTLVIADAYRSIAAQNDLYMIGRSSYCDSDFFCLIDSRKTVPMPQVDQAGTTSASRSMYIPFRKVGSTGMRREPTTSPS